MSTLLATSLHLRPPTPTVPHTAAALSLPPPRHSAINEIYVESRSCDVAAIQARLQSQRAEKDLLVSARASAVLRERLSASEARCARLEDQELSDVTAIARLHEKASRVERMREAVYLQRKKDSTRHREEVLALQGQLAAAEQQLAALAVGRNAVTLVRDAVDAALVAQTAKHAADLKAQRQVAAGKAAQASAAHRAALMAEMELRWAAERELAKERHAARAAVGQERRDATRAGHEQRTTADLLAAAASTVRSEQTLRGHAVARAEAAEALLDKQGAVRTTQRLQERRDSGKTAELNAAREATTELRAQLQELGAAPLEQRQVAGRVAGAMDEDTTCPVRAQYVPVTCT